jgi:putative phage-type endonuclease
MNRELIPLRDDAHWHSLRAQDLTSTDIAALFGMSPYATAVDVWHAKRDGIVETLEDNERMRWGRRLESVVAEGIAEDQGWSVRPFKEYGRLPEHRLGASFDYRVTTHKVQFMQGDGSFVDGTIDGPDDFVLEIKTVDALAFRSGWTVEPDFIEAPAHIELQIQHQLLVSGLRIGYIGALVGGNTVRLIRREADNDVHAAILQRAAEFWQSVTTGTPPPITTADEARAYVKRQTNVEPGRLFDARGNRAVEELLRDYRLASSTHRPRPTRPTSSKPAARSNRRVRARHVRRRHDQLRLHRRQRRNHYHRRHDRHYRRSPRRVPEFPSQLQEGMNDDHRIEAPQAPRPRRQGLRNHRRRRPAHCPRPRQDAGRGV